MECPDAAVSYLSWSLVVGGVALLLFQIRIRSSLYGRYLQAEARCCPAKLGWFLQEVPAFLFPILLLITEDQHTDSGKTGDRTRDGTGDGTRDGTRDGTVRTLLLFIFMLHYFHRSFIYAFLTKGRPVPVFIVLMSAIFCSLNGFLQGHHLLHCARFEDTWLTKARLAAGVLLFVVGMIINIHSDHILRSLRRPGETVYRIPYGGMFEFVSCANYFGEIVEWCGYALAAWSFPTTAFAFFTACSIGPRAYRHHRDYHQRFEDYPRSRTALIPLIL